MKQGVDYEHSYSLVQHASGFCTMIALATAEDMFIDHVDISKAFLQGDMLEEEGFEGNVYISPPPGYGEDAKYVYRLLRTTIRYLHQQSGMAQSHVSFDRAAGLQDSRLRPAPMQTETRSWRAVTLTISAYAAQTKLTSTNSDSRCSTLPRADSKAYTKDLWTTI